MTSEVYEKGNPMTTPEATKIVIVSGQEFSVPAATDNEAIRQQLSGMGFADVAAATIQKGKRQVDGQEVETIEFVKKAGTKGLDGAGLAQLLDTLPQSTLPPPVVIGPNAEQAHLLQQLWDGELSFADALDHEPELAQALDACGEVAPPHSQEGAALCRTLDQLVAAPCAAPVAW